MGVTYHERTAAISDDGVYRYRLYRSWDLGPVMAFVMLNPSTADGEVDDPTIRRCVKFADREGCRKLVVVNLFAYRATDPAALHKADDPIGPANRLAVEEVMADIGVKYVVAAWGAWWSNTPVERRPSRMNIRALAERHDRTIHHLGPLTASGDPRHPLYLRGDAPLNVYEGL